MAAYMIISFITGINYMCIIASLLTYFRDIIKTDQYVLYYSMTFGCFAISGSLSEMIFGRIVDKTQKGRPFIAIGSVCGIIGGLIYAIYCSPIFPVIGRIFGGIQTSFPTIATGELIRMHEGENAVKVQYWLAAFYSLGIVVGPVLNILFKDVDVSCGIIRLNPNNSVGLLMAFLGLIALALTTFFVTDSKDMNIRILPSGEGFLNERDPMLETDRVAADATIHKSDRSFQLDTKESARSDTEDSEIENFQRNDYMPTSIEVFKNFIKSPYLCLMMISTLHFAGGAFTLDILISIINYDFFQWNLDSLTIIYTVSMVLYALYLFLLSKCCVTGSSVYAVTLLCIVLNITTYVTVYVIKVYAKVHWQQVTSMCIFVATYSIVWVIDEALLRIMTAKMVPKHLVCQAEAYRRLMNKISYIAASALLPVIVKYIVYWAWIMVIATLVMLLIYVYHWKSLSCIKQMQI